MTRIILTYGLISGVVIIIGIMVTMALGNGHHDSSNLYLGYLIMLVALSSILVGIKQYRDRNLGGVIKFVTGLQVGLGIALVAALAYVAIWEAYLAVTHYAFVDQYAASMMAGKKAAGAAAYAEAVKQVEAFRAAYANPLMRMGYTFIEIFPVGLIVAIVSAILLRFPKFLPARGRAA
jgi:hypothetical protein